MHKISIRICLFNCLLDISEPNTWKIESIHNGCFSSFPKYRFLWYYLTRQKLWLLWGWGLYAGMAAKYCSPPPADPQKLINSNFRNWISTCSWKMKSRRRAGLLPPENVVSTNRSSSKVSQGPFAFIDPDTLNSLVQGGRGWLAFSHRKKIPQSFRRTTKMLFFIRSRGNRQFVFVKGLSHTQTHSLYKSRMTFVKSSTKAGWLSLRNSEKAMLVILASKSTHLCNLS